MDNFLYKKRSGTTGVSGQLYETKLLSLALFRASHDDDIEEFYMATNVDGLGNFDDICMRFKRKQFDKPTVVFVQAKHKDDQNKIFAISKIGLVKYFNSYLQIRTKFSANNLDPLFKGSYEDVECAFVFYTNANDEMKKKYEENDLICKISDIIGTGDDAFRISYTDEDVKMLNKIVLHEQIMQLGEVVAKIVLNEGYKYENIMNNELIQIYHVILAQQVFDLTHMDLNFYECQIRSEFFETSDVNLIILKQKIFSEVLKETKLSEQEAVDRLKILFSKTSVQNISKVIGSVIMLRDGKLEFVDAKSYKDMYLHEQLKRVCVTESLVAEAIDIAGRELLQPVKFKVPLSFGNSDLTLRGNDIKIEKRLNHLSMQIVKMLKQSEEKQLDSETFNIVHIDENFPEKGLLQINGGIAGAVGNLLVFDNKTKLLMIEKVDNLKGHAKTLLKKINNEVGDIEKYRFDVNVNHFPILSFDCSKYGNGLVDGFLTKLLLYTNQASESEVESILKTEIAEILNKSQQCSFKIKSDAVFLKLHDAIQKWWIKQNNAEYLTKSYHFFQQTAESYINKPLLSIVNIWSRNKIITNSVKFDVKILNSIELDNLSSPITVIVSDVVNLSVIKVTQYLEGEDYILVDLSYILELPANDQIQLKAELESVKEKIFILNFDKFKHVVKAHTNITQIINSLTGNRVIIITNKNLAKEYLSNFETTIKYEGINLEYLTTESQDMLLSNTNVIFQGVRVCLNFILDNESKVLIKGQCMNKIMNAEDIVLGESLKTLIYEHSQPFYINRHIKFVSRGSTTLDGGGYQMHASQISDQEELRSIETFNDINDHIVILTASPGMGKSSLLTHLSVKTKESNVQMWIVRIDLLDYSRVFHEWKENNTAMDILQVLKFICLTLVNNKVNRSVINNNVELIEVNDGIYLNNSTDLAKPLVFEISMFLHWCNRRKVIFVFDGFDEICPHYEAVVFEMFKVLERFHPSEHRIWISCRMYNNVLHTLVNNLVAQYQLQPWTLEEQIVFVHKHLENNLNINQMSQAQIEKVNDFMLLMNNSLKWSQRAYHRTTPIYFIYCVATLYFKNAIRKVAYLEDKEKYLKPWDLRELDSDLKKYFYFRRNLRHSLIFLETPLYIHMWVDMFLFQIRDTKPMRQPLILCGRYLMYERFITMILSNIRFEIKNRMDLSRPDVLAIFERECREFKGKHQKLGAYAVFYHYKEMLFNEAQLTEIKYVIDSIKTGKETSGVIINVVNEVPRFVHMIFAEYFAVEYICALLISRLSDNELTSLWNFILKVIVLEKLQGVLDMLEFKSQENGYLKSCVMSERSKNIILNLIKEHAVEATRIVQESTIDPGEALIRELYYRLPSLFPPNSLG